MLLMNLKTSYFIYLVNVLNYFLSNMLVLEPGFDYGFKAHVHLVAGISFISFLSEGSTINQNECATIPDSETGSVR